RLDVALCHPRAQPKRRARGAAGSGAELPVLRASPLAAELATPPRLRAWLTAACLRAAGRSESGGARRLPALVELDLAGHGVPRDHLHTERLAAPQGLDFATDVSARQGIRDLHAALARKDRTRKGAPPEGSRDESVLVDELYGGDGHGPRPRGRDEAGHDGV